MNFKFQFQITEEDERTSSKNSLDKDFADRLRRQLISKDDKVETSSIVESEDGVSKIKITTNVGIESNASTESIEEKFRQVIEVKDNDQEEHRKISSSLESGTLGSEEIGRN